MVCSCCYITDKQAHNNSIKSNTQGLVFIYKFADLVLFLLFVAPGFHLKWSIKELVEHQKYLQPEGLGILQLLLSLNNTMVVKKVRVSLSGLLKKIIEYLRIAMWYWIIITQYCFTVRWICRSQLVHSSILELLDCLMGVEEELRGRLVPCTSILLTEQHVSLPPRAETNRHW